MDKIENIRMKQIEADLEQSKANPNRASDAIVVFPEKERSGRRRPVDLRKIWDYLLYFRPNPSNPHIAPSFWS